MLRHVDTDNVTLKAIMAEINNELTAETEDAQWEWNVCRGAARGLHGHRAVRECGCGLCRDQEAEAVQRAINRRETRKFRVSLKETLPA